jgi:peptide/nickel transport system permease protein
VPVLLGVALIAFIFSELSGDPIRAVLGEHTTPEIEAKVRAHYGFDKPRSERFLIYVGNLARGNLGVSIHKQGAPVNEIIGAGMRVTFLLALGAVLFAILMGVSLGIASARRPYGMVDYASSAVAALGVSFPAFLLGMLLLMVFAVHLGWFPVGTYEPGELKYLVLPCVSLGLISTASIARLTRNCILEALNQDYVRSSRAKGLGEWRALLGHALPNALVPIITIIGADFGSLLTGAVLTETVFGLPGIGQQMANAIFARDLPVVMGCCVVMALIFVTVNLLVDLSYAFLDPRIRYG